MSFPSISFFFQLDSYYQKISSIYLHSYYFKLHNIIFTNLYIRIYRNKLINAGIGKKKKRKNIEQKKMDKFQKNRFHKKYNKFRPNTEFHRNFSFNIFLNNISVEEKKKKFSFKFKDNKNYKHNRYNKSARYKQKKKKEEFDDPFIDCGNQYNFDPFYPYNTHKLNDFNLLRNKKIKKQKSNAPKSVNKLNLSIFDSRLKNINFKYFNNYVFSLLLNIYKNKKTNKHLFLSTLKNNNVFFYNFLLFLKKRIIMIRYSFFEYKKRLNSYLIKIDLLLKIFKIIKNDISLLSYIKKRNFNIFFMYKRIILSFNKNKEKYNFYYKLLSEYKKIYFSSLSLLKKKYHISKKRKQDRNAVLSRMHSVSKHEKLFHHLFGSFAKNLSFFNFNNFLSLNKWEKREIQDDVYINISKYVTLFRSLFRDQILSKYNNNGTSAIIYIKATLTNVFLYFVYNNKLLFKKTCGELPDIKKKERRFWRNVYPLVEQLLPFLVKMKLKYKFPFVSLYINGSYSLCSPLLSSIRKHNKKFRRLLSFISNEYDFFMDKTYELKEKFSRNYMMLPQYRLKLFSIFDGFNRLSKIFFAINKVKDITSWPYNGCKKKKKKNVR